MKKGKNKLVVNFELDVINYTSLDGTKYEINNERLNEILKSIAVERIDDYNIKHKNKCILNDKLYKISLISSDTTV